MITIFHKISGSCNMCGMCCKAIVLPVSYEKLLEFDTVKKYLEEPWNFENRIGEHDPLFVYLYWKPITKEEAFKINPYLKEWEKEYTNEDNLKKFNFWTCTKHDSITNKCLEHDRRPDVCSKYPWYNRMPHDTHFYSETCGYNIDLLHLEKVTEDEQEQSLPKQA